LAVLVSGAFAFSTFGKESIMRILREPAEIAAIPYPGIRDLVRQRMAELSPYDPALMGEFILVEPGDTPASLEASSGCWITTSLLGDAKYGEPDFVPSFEWLEHHVHEECFEMLFIMNDDGYGIALFVPDAPDINAELLALCREYAVSTAEAK